MYSFCLQTRSEALRRFDDSNHRTFIKRLVHFFKPSSNRYSRVEIGSNRKAANARTLAALELLDVLLIADEASPSPQVPLFPLKKLRKVMGSFCYSRRVRDFYRSC